MKRFSEFKSKAKTQHIATKTDLALEDASYAHTKSSINGLKVTSSAHSENSVSTLHVGNVALPNRIQTAVPVCKELILKHINAKNCPSIAPVTVICLGNSSVTADAIGPLCAKKIYATRHLKTELPALFYALGGREISVISTGVTAETGICALEIAKWCKKELHSSLIITVDALKAARRENLLSVIQFSSGVAPGSGTDSTRPEISEKTVGVPIISIGVPTVISPQALTENSKKRRWIAPAIRQNTENDSLDPLDSASALLTLADCSCAVNAYADVISSAINSALIGDFPDQRKE